jgi:hypothetical protein
VTIINGASVAQVREVRIDAKNRAMRTLIQGFFIDLLIASATTAYTLLTGENFSWAVLGLAVLKTLLTTATSYVMRIKLGDALITPNQASEPVKVMIGSYEMELQRPGKADHAVAQG